MAPFSQELEPPPNPGRFIGYTEDVVKDAGMRIRVEQELRDAFVDVCQKLDVPAAQVIREHMKEVVQQTQKTSTRLTLRNKKNETQ
jgi:hypothetical protein